MLMYWELGTDKSELTVTLQVYNPPSADLTGLNVSVVIKLSWTISNGDSVTLESSEPVVPENCLSTMTAVSTPVVFKVMVQVRSRVVPS